MVEGMRADPNLSYIDSVALIPVEEPGDRQTKLTRCSNGEYNSHYRTRGERYRGRGIRNIIIRPGWEMNIPSFPWGFDYKDDLAQLYSRCFAHFVQSIRDVYPDSESGFMFDWNLQQGGLDLFNIESPYPGDQYVDIISVDFYDTFRGDNNTGICRGIHNGALDQSPECRVQRWIAQKTKVLDKVNGFAKRRGKWFAFPEWGVITTGDDFRYVSNHGGGDNPYFIEKSCEYIKDPANNVFYYTWYDDLNETGGGVDARIGNKPLSLAKFREKCVGNPDPAPAEIRNWGTR